MSGDLDYGQAVRVSTPFTVIETYVDEFGEDMVAVHNGGPTVPVPAEDVEVIDDE